MIDLTPDAKVRFEQYLQRLRGSLRGTRAVEADEVEQNVREHVEIALAGAPSPVAPPAWPTCWSSSGRRNSVFRTKSVRRGGEPWTA